MPEMQIEAIADLDEVVRMLANCGLPVSDISPGARSLFFGVRSGSALVAVVGLELFNSVALLRSLAVQPSHRHCGLGKELVAFAERTAAERGVERLFLLTTTASEFFSRLGFTPAERSSAPREIQSTTQFSGLCPASAAFLFKTLVK